MSEAGWSWRSCWCHTAVKRSLLLQGTTKDRWPPLTSGQTVWTGKERGRLPPHTHTHTRMGSLRVTPAKTCRYKDTVDLFYVCSREDVNNERAFPLLSSFQSLINHCIIKPRGTFFCLWPKITYCILLTFSHRQTVSHHDSLPLPLPHTQTLLQRIWLVSVSGNRVAE